MNPCALPRKTGSCRGYRARLHREARCFGFKPVIRREKHEGFSSPFAFIHFHLPTSSSRKRAAIARSLLLAYVAPVRPLLATKMARTRSERVPRAHSQGPPTAGAGLKRKKAASKGGEKQQPKATKTMGNWFLPWPPTGNFRASWR